MYPAPTHKRINELDIELARLQKSTRATIPVMVGIHDILRQKFRWYYNWHLNSWASLAHWLTLAGCTITAFILVLALVLKVPAKPVLGATSQVWSNTVDWGAWKLENLTATNDGLKLAQKQVQGISTKRLAQATKEIPAVTPNDPVVTPSIQASPEVTPGVTPEVSPTAVITPTPTPSVTATSTPTPSVTSGSDSAHKPTPTPSVTVSTPTPSPSATVPASQYVSKGTATLTFDPRKGEIVDWLKTESTVDLNGGGLKVEFSTDNILWTDEVKTLSNSDKVYLRLTLTSDNASSSPILRNIGVSYSRLPLTPEGLQVSSNMGILGLDQTVSAGIFTDPDGDSHLASQWQITDKSGEYTSTIDDSDVDTKNLTSYSIKRKLANGSYYFRVRYQDSVEAWSPWSQECAFTVNQSKIVVSGDNQIQSNKNEIVSKRTQTTKTIDNKDGTKSLIASSGIIHYKENYKDDKDPWKDINASHFIDFPDFVL